jgi:hypothetical protein
MAGTIFANFYAKVSSASATLHFSYGRSPFAGGSPTLLLTDTQTSAFSNTSYFIISQSSAVSESVGTAFNDRIYLKVWATTTSTSSVTVTLGSGITNRSNINTPFIIQTPVD